MYLRNFQSSVDEEVQTIYLASPPPIKQLPPFYPQSDTPTMRNRHAAEL